MMKTTAVLILILVGVAVLVQGCHRGKKIKPKRRPRSTSTTTEEEEENNRLIEFFTDCLSRVLSRRRESIPTIVKFTILDTKWFVEGDLLYCRGKDDTRDCWKNAIPFLIDKKSEFYFPSRYCIRRYTNNLTGRRKRSVQSDFAVFLDIGDNFKKFLIFIFKNQNNPRYDMVDPYNDINAITDFIQQLHSSTIPITATPTTTTTTATTTTTTTVPTTIRQRVNAGARSFRPRGVAPSDEQVSVTLHEDTNDECIDFEKYYQCTKKSESESSLTPSQRQQTEDELKLILSFVWKDFSRCRKSLPRNSKEIKDRRCIIGSQEDNRMDGQCISDIILDKIVIPSSPLMPILRTCKAGGLPLPVTIGRGFNGSSRVVNIFKADPCNGTWTEWANNFHPEGTNGDFETLWRTRLFKIDDVCFSPTSIDIRYANGTPLNVITDVIEYSNDGLCCENARQPSGMCNDYAVRFCC